MNSPLGTLGFMAPEQAQGRWDLVGPKTDLFAVAATLLKLSTGLDLYDAPDAQQRFILSTSKPVTPLAQREASLPPALCTALDRALSFAQRDRSRTPASSGARWKDWQKEVAGTLPKAPAETLPPPPATSANPWRVRIVAIAAAALVGAALGWMWITATHPTQTSPGSGTLGAP